MSAVFNNQEASMPLKSGKSKAAFSANVRTEAKTKPLRQSIAIAYAVARRGAKKGK